MGRLPRYRGWLIVALVMLVAGTATSFFAARTVANAQADQARQLFHGASNGIASTVRSAIQRQDDLVVNASGFVTLNPDATNARFARWAETDQILGRYPELLGISQAVLVPTAGLATFAARAVADPAGPLANGRFQVQPPEAKPFYCLAQVARWRDPKVARPAGYDFCANGHASTLLAARDSGEPRYLSIPGDNPTSLLVVAALYRNGSLPTTVAARQAAFQGWILVTINPGVIVDHAVGARPRGARVLAVDLRHRGESSDIAVERGRAPAGARSTTDDLAGAGHCGPRV